MLAPTLDALARDYVGRLLVFKIDTSNQHVNAQRFHVRGVPTLLLFKNGQLLDQIVGAVPRGEIEQRLRALLQ